MGSEGKVMRRGRGMRARHEGEGEVCGRGRGMRVRKRHEGTEHEGESITIYVCGTCVCV